jgi:ribosomal protein L22
MALRKLAVGFRSVTKIPQFSASNFTSTFSPSICSSYTTVNRFAFAQSRYLSTESATEGDATSMVVSDGSRRKQSTKPPWYDDPNQWKSKASKKEISDKTLKIKISPRKLALIIDPIRGLSVDEVLIQMRLSTKKKSMYVRQLVWKLREDAINKYNMDPSRLVLTGIFSNKAQYGKRINFHAKGQMGIRFKYYANLFATITEVPPVEGEVRVGKHYLYGRTHSTIKATLEKMEKVREQEAKEKEEAPPRKYTWGLPDKRMPYVKS